MVKENLSLIIDSILQAVIGQGFLVIIWDMIVVFVHRLSLRKPMIFLKYLKPFLFLLFLNLLIINN